MTIVFTVWFAHCETPIQNGERARIIAAVTAVLSGTKAAMRPSRNISSPVPGCISSDEDDFEDCPSVVTEVAVDELEDTPAGEEEDTEVVQVTKEDAAAEEETQESEAALVSDEEEYVMTEEPDSEEEDFVDVRADIIAAYEP